MEDKLFARAVEITGRDLTGATTIELATLTATILISKLAMLPSNDFCAV